ncbi:GDP-mannose 4,6-dehydratase [Oxalobacter formigenes]|uniref:GDP-mannose 4,6-dehydratase n=1 Tax=Oxalobacter formigenes TaxID=847 RepID=UPI0022AF7902|nr:GDP-mannose 4,6-dehydratase [Oxalobacter formigenes]WAW02456.1 GDP-mannose 4,6-dehydratase [Oxalobacter formigenes]WAW02724.1 GDP-mannose 4,6-dehydratase [Oxalobacter formigenes]
MKKFFVTGIGGFVGRYFLEYLQQNEADFQVMGVDMMSSLPWDEPHFQYRSLDMTDSAALQSILSGFKPDYVLHLAAISSVGQSWKAPAECFKNNTGIFLNLLEAIRSECPGARILSVGSSEVYGDYSPNAMPLKEDYQLIPGNPYAVARAGQEMCSKLYVQSFGMKIMMTRSFNHIGPRQKETFVIPSFVNQLVRIAQNGGVGTIITGNTEIIRDFLDVRDVVVAYYLILTQGKPGDIYNVCSGEGMKLKDIIEKTSILLNVSPVIQLDASLMRPTDSICIIGDNTKLMTELGWKRQFLFTQTLQSIIDYFLRIK